MVRLRDSGWSLAGCNSGIGHFAATRKPKYHRDALQTLRQPLILKKGKSENWQWAAKFWHFLNHDAFPIRDSRTDEFFGVKGNSALDKYSNFLNEFTQFVLPKQNWLPHLRQVDAYSACCANKLWDKVFYGIKELAGKPIRRKSKTKRGSERSGSKVGSTPKRL